MVKIDSHGFFLPLLAIVAIVLLCGWHYEAYEAVVNAQFNGALAAIPQGNMYIYAYFCTYWIYPLLYKSGMVLPFYALGTLSFTAAAVLLFGYGLLKKKNFPELAVAIIAFGSNFFWVSNVRVAILCAMLGASVGLLKSGKKWWVATGILLMVYGCSVRYEIGLVVAGVSVCFWWLSGGAPFQRTWGRYSILAGVGIAVLAGAAFVAAQNPYLQKLHYLTYLSSVSDQKLTTSTAQNSLFIEALNQYVVSDTAFINRHAAYLPHTAGLLWQRAKTLLSQSSHLPQVIGLLWHAVLPEMLSYLLCVLWLLCIVPTRLRHLAANMLLLVALLFVLAALKADVRFASSYLMAGTLFNLCLLSKHCRQPIAGLVALSLVPTALLQLQQLQHEHRLQLAIELQNTAYIKQFNQLPYTTLALNMNSINLFNTGIVPKDVFDPAKKIMPVDMGDFTCIVAVNRTLHQKFGINSMSMPEVYAYLASLEESAVYLSSPQRVDFLKRFFEESYGLCFEFKPVAAIKPMRIDGQTIIAYSVSTP